MTLRAEVIDAMPIGVEMSAPEIARRIWPDMKSWETKSHVVGVYNKLILSEDNGTVTSRIVTRGKRKVRMWTRVM